MWLTGIVLAAWGAGAPSTPSGSTPAASAATGSIRVTLTGKTSPVTAAGPSQRSSPPASGKPKPSCQARPPRHQARPPGGASAGRRGSLALGLGELGEAGVPPTTVAYRCSLQCFHSPNRCWCSRRYGHRRGTTSKARRDAARLATPISQARPRPRIQQPVADRLALVPAWAPSLLTVAACNGRGGGAVSGFGAGPC